MGYAGDGFGESAGWKEILAQGQDGDASIMLFLGEEIQDALSCPRLRTHCFLSKWLANAGQVRLRDPC